VSSACKDKGRHTKEATASKRDHVRGKKFIQNEYKAQIDPRKKTPKVVSSASCMQVDARESHARRLHAPTASLDSS
jgi:hypothetical protein